MTSIPLDQSNRDFRIQSIRSLLQGLSNSDTPEVKHIIDALAQLKEYLVVSDRQAGLYERRVNSILEILLRYTLIDFSMPAEVSELGDDLDAIAVGINTLAEELQDKIEAETRNAERLQEQNIKLERINKELASFAYVSSHDLQEPLRKINTYISRIMDEEVTNLPEQVRFYLDRIQTAASRMQKLIRDILDYSKINTAEADLETVDLGMLATEAREDFEEALTEKNGSFTIGRLCEIKIVPFQFKRVVNNLLSNSIKFSDPSRPLQVSLSSTIESGKELAHLDLLPSQTYCHITYKDNGIGFDEQYNERIFEVFQRLHNQADYEGTGVGLAICKRIVENHGGSIRASGELNKGAAFDIYLPI